MLRDSHDAREVALPHDQFIENFGPEEACLSVGFSPLVAIEARQGTISAGDITPGTRLRCLASQEQPVHHVGWGSRQPRTPAVRIQAGALGNDLPYNDLIVRANQRILVCSEITLRMFAKPEVLVEAGALCLLPGVTQEAHPCEAGVGGGFQGGLAGRFVEISLAVPDIIFAEGVPCGAQVASRTRHSPNRCGWQQGRRSYHANGGRRIKPSQPARPWAHPMGLCVTSQQQQRLVRRHLKNSKPLLPQTRKE